MHEIYQYAGYTLSYVWIRSLGMSIIVYISSSKGIARILKMGGGVGGKNSSNMYGKFWN